MVSKPVSGRVEGRSGTGPSPPAISVATKSAAPRSPSEKGACRGSSANRASNSAGSRPNRSAMARIFFSDAAGSAHQSPADRDPTHFPPEKTGTAYSESPRKQGFMKGPEALLHKLSWTRLHRTHRA